MSKSYNIDDWFKKHKVWSGILIFIAFAILISPFTSDSEKMKTDSSVNEPRTSEAAPVTSTNEAQQTQSPAPKAEEEKPNVPPEYKSALNKAETYSSIMNMSKRGVYDQLVSEYGEKFTAEAAQYAIDNVKADWKANALAKAKTYQNEMSMSPAAIRDQLVTEYGEKFTVAEADYAIQNLNN